MERHENAQNHRRYESTFLPDRSAVFWDITVSSSKVEWLILLVAQGFSFEAVHDAHGQGRAAIGSRCDLCRSQSWVARSDCARQAECVYRCSTAA